MTAVPPHKKGEKPLSERVTLPLKEVDGEMYLPAAVVSALLCGFETATGEADFDPQTVDSLAEALTGYADQLNVEAIARTTGPVGGGAGR
jgi:hypothetical protein